MEIEGQSSPRTDEKKPEGTIPDSAAGPAVVSASSQIEVPAKLIDQVIGQEHAVEVIKKAAIQRRHVMMIGSPGTGKSMLAKAMAELLPKEELQDILVYPNSDDNNNPVIRTVAAGRGKQIVAAHKAEAKKKIQFRNTLLMLLLLGIAGYAIITMQLLMGLIAGAFVFMALRYSTPREEAMVPKLLVSNDTKSIAPFIDGTGSHAGALLGDVRHDPFQSGGLETPSHDRVEAGAIHRSNGGVLFIDEINTLDPHSQQNLLTALQEGEFPITGQSERSSGAMVRTEPVPCKFVMIAAGNLDAIQGMHPALRSRIRGYGYEVYMAESMEDNEENRKKYIRFIAQEVKNDAKIPHFDQSAIDEIIREAKRRSNRKGHLTLKLRDMGGLIRVAGDIARQENAALTTSVHVITAKKTARSIEDQVSDEITQHLREYEMTIVEGTRIGRVNGLAVTGNDAGSVLPIMAEVTPDGAAVQYGAHGGYNAHAGARIFALELAAKVTRDGRYRWVAHRLMNFGQARGFSSTHHHIQALSLEDIALARAFVLHPPLLLADEPTGSLDARTGEAVIDLMFELNRERGSTLVMVTHDPDIARRCGRQVELSAGRIVSPAAVTTSPSS